jgi:anti-anti-sigma factor
MSDDLLMTEVAFPPQTAVLRVSGTMNARTTPDLLRKCRDVKDRHMSLVLNLSEVVFIASSGIGALLALVEEFHESGLSIRFAALSTAVDSVVKLLNLDGFLSIDRDEVVAVEALARGNAYGSSGAYGERNAA